MSLNQWGTWPHTNRKIKGESTMKFKSVVTEIRVYERDDHGNVLKETLKREVSEEKAEDSKK